MDHGRTFALRDGIKKNNISFNELEYIQHRHNCAGLGVAVSTSHATATGKETRYRSVGNLSAFYFLFSHVAFP